MSEFNIEYVLNTVNDIYEDMKSELIEKLIESKSYGRIEGKLSEKYPEFAENYPFLLKKIAKNENIDYLYKMIEGLKEIEMGNKTMEEVEKSLGEGLADKFLYKNDEIEKLQKKKIDIENISNASDVSSVSDISDM